MGIYFFLIIIIIIIVLDLYNNNFNHIIKSNNKSIINNNYSITDNINNINNNKNKNINNPIINNTISTINKSNNKNNKNKLTNIIPWSQIINDGKTDLYCIKISIPSLSDYENWKNIITGLDFDPKTKEIMIPATDELEALVIAFYINLNFSSQILFDNIIKEDLLNIKLVEIKNNKDIEKETREHIINIHKPKELNNIIDNNNFESYDNNNSGTYFSYL